MDQAQRLLDAEQHDLGVRERLLEEVAQGNRPALLLHLEPPGAVYAVVAVVVLGFVACWFIPLAGPAA